MARPPEYGEDLAWVHHVGFGGFAREAAPGLLALLRARGLAGGTVVDLGCGDGGWLVALGRAGYDAVGIEQSPAFVALARRAAPRARVVQGSIHGVALPPAAACTALGEVLNYGLTPRAATRALPRLFRRVHRALAPGGLFVFDMVVAGRRRTRPGGRGRAGRSQCV
ncbi:MAG: methyltransferase domain-containing protein [Vicinamibacterales bacterium]